MSIQRILASAAVLVFAGMEGGETMKGTLTVS